MLNVVNGDDEFIGGGKRTNEQHVSFIRPLPAAKLSA
jgi:hypothetical protein